MKTVVGAPETTNDPLNGGNPGAAGDDPEYVYVPFGSKRVIVGPVTFQVCPRMDRLQLEPAGRYVSVKFTG
jgi:hypothetical protein